MKSLLYVMVLMATVCGSLAMSRHDFSRYNLIVKRRPFAPPADAVNAAASNVITVVKPPAFVKDLRMCAITESPAGMKVGFVNIRQKPQKPYYMYVGDSEDGIELVDADYDKGGALLRKGGEQFWMYMGGGSTGAAAGSSKKQMVGRGPGSFRKKSGPGGVSSAMPSSYAERRRKRLEELRRIADEERRKSDEEIKKKLQEYQMERLRKGLVPLPLQLTPEADAELVKEGVLPPISEEGAAAEEDVPPDGNDVVVEEVLPED
jgi:hypothetical protein